MGEDDLKELEESAILQKRLWGSLDEIKGETIVVMNKLGIRYSGVLYAVKSITPTNDFTITLKFAQRLNDGEHNPNTRNFNDFQENLEINNIASFYAYGIHAVHFQGEKNLIKWTDENTSDIGPKSELVDVDVNDSGAWDQFEENRTRFNIQYTYKEEYYTTELDKESEFYQKNKIEAENIAKKIEKTATTEIHVLEDRGQQVITDENMNEEDMYSRVLRSEKGYVPPQLRKKSKPEKNNKKNVLKKSPLPSQSESQQQQEQQPTLPNKNIEPLSVSTQSSFSHLQTLPTTFTPSNQTTINEFSPSSLSSQNRLSSSQHYQLPHQQIQQNDHENGLQNEYQNQHQNEDSHPYDHHYENGQQLSDQHQYLSERNQQEKLQSEPELNNLTQISSQNPNDYQQLQLQLHYMQLNNPQYQQNPHLLNLINQPQLPQINAQNFQNQINPMFSGIFGAPVNISPYESYGNEYSSLPIMNYNHQQFSSPQTQSLQPSQPTINYNNPYTNDQNQFPSMETSTKHLNPEAQEFTPTFTSPSQQQQQRQSEPQQQQSESQSQLQQQQQQMQQLEHYQQLQQMQHYQQLQQLQQLQQQQQQQQQQPNAMMNPYGIPNQYTHNMLNIDVNQPTNFQQQNPNYLFQPSFFPINGQNYIQSDMQNPYPFIMQQPNFNPVNPYG